MKKSITTIKDYDHWANKSLIEYLMKIEVDDQDINKLLSRIVELQALWINRFGEKASTIDLSEDYRSIKRTIDSNNFIINDVIYEHDPNDIFSYEDESGNVCKNSVYDILVHMFMESSFIRGEIKNRLEKLSKPMINVDYITFCKEY